MRRSAILVAVVVLLVEILYLDAIRAQPVASSDMPWRVPFVAGYIILLAACAALGALVSVQPWPAVFLGAAVGGLLLLGFFALFSVGLALLVAGLVAIVPLVRALRGAPHRRLAGGMAITGAFVAVGILFAGFAVTERIITCPPGAQSGGGSTLLSGTYSYTCESGKAVVTWGR